MTYFIQFVRGPRLAVHDFFDAVNSGFGDEAIEEARNLVEKEVGPLPEDPRTEFPSFTITDEDGNEIGGG